MAIVLLPFFLLNVILCNGFPWRQDIPVDFKEVIDIHEEETIRKFYDTHKSEDVMKLDPFFNPNAYLKQYVVSKITGKNCGSPTEVISVNSLTLPDEIVLGENATIAVNATIKKRIETASLLKVVVQKVGLPVDIPCMDNIGTCNYTNPCDILKKFPCPPEVIKLGWNCRCPFKKMVFVLPSTSVPVPTVALPAFLVDGSYNIKIQLFNGSSELFCYIVEVKLKEK